MKILHVIPHFYKDNEILKESMLLANRMSEQTETHVAIFERDAKQLPNNHITFHLLYSRNPLECGISLSSQYIDILYKVMPDIVHIHGCWNVFAAKAEKWSRKRGFRVVVSPHDRLRKYAWNISFLKTRLLPMLTYQRNMIRHAYALHANNETEKKNITALKWNNRIESINTERPENILLFYQKIMNSNVHQLMSVDERQTICYLLHTALAGELWRLESQLIEKIKRLNATQWKRIFLYAEDEYVTDFLQKGINMLQLDVPDVSTTHMRYTPRIKKSDKALNREKGLISMLTDAQKLQKKHQLSLRHLAAIYQELIRFDGDEDELARLLRKKKKIHFTARIEQILSETFFLTEGFMPVERRNDHITEKIRKNII